MLKYKNFKMWIYLMNIPKKKLKKNWLIENKIIIISCLSN